jgi:hypothetical protein
MKIAVINFSGNVGKTTIARRLLLPRVADARLITVESVNAGHEDSAALRGHQFGVLQERLLMSDAAIVDIGASNVVDLLDHMRQFPESQADLDYFVVPTVAPLKQQQDTIATLAELSLLGVSPARTRIIFNNLGPKDDIQESFGPLIAYLKKSGTARFEPACRISASELHERLDAADLSLEEMARDNMDYKAQIAITTDASHRLSLVRRLAMRRMACGVVAELDACFAALKLKPSTVSA